MSVKVLIVDDEEGIRDSLSEILKEEGYRVSSASTLSEAKQRITEEFFHVVVLDVWMPDGDGIDFIEVLKELSPDTVVVVITGHGNVEMAVRAIRNGAYDFIEKPFSMDRFLITVKHASSEALSRRVRESEEQIELIGNSKRIREIKEMIPKIAKSKAPVLILGESGTGKELVARLIHRYSGRAGQFVDINCASIPNDLIESELFGYEKGAFTGAVSRKKGKFELADGGTLFLDEIGDMELRAQAKLLRVIETGSFTRLGSTQKIDIDVRIVSASNKDILSEVHEGQFREDLYYRIAVFTIELPPLRERGEDIILLAEYFLNKFASEYKKECKVFSDEAKEVLLKHRWKGNVRELRNLIERIVILCDKEVIKPEHIGGVFTKSSKDYSYIFKLDSFREARKEFEKTYIEEKLKEYNYDMKEVASNIGIDLSNLYRKVKAYGIKLKNLQGSL
ncbi:two-component system NtrC family response regulator [Hydrogenivirga caldilitoris]|uniref:Two-component system NtrC family response regulator n=1 Tax=Hydrogenivirga caldilitoris TaxID=246264 RepID=A0A497XWM1_9AQUI|nr:sigma-54 dependent transcriptional regulator [Hydrogenivirga caldilitoris]RLJ71552.1 two-component system NtrC family response regulator [Hydrogenivirga caldilitoris]